MSYNSPFSSDMGGMAVAPERNPSILSSPPLKTGGPDPMMMIRLGFAYLFENDEYTPAMVDTLLAPSGVVRYSHNFASNFDRGMAIVLFNAAQHVYNARRSGDEKCIRFGDQVVIFGSKIAAETGLNPEEVYNILRALTDFGVLTHYVCDRGGEMIFNDWYTFADEQVVFPAIGEAKYSKEQIPATNSSLYPKDQTPAINSSLGSRVVNGLKQAN